MEGAHAEQGTNYVMMSAASSDFGLTPGMPINAASVASDALLPPPVQPPVPEFADFSDATLRQDLLGPENYLEMENGSGTPPLPFDEEQQDSGELPDKPRVAFWRLLLLPLNLGASNLLAATLLVTIIPMQILEMVGSEWKGTAQGVTLFLGVAISIVSGPFAGYISDRTRSRLLGRRKPYIVGTALLRAVFAVLMVFIGSVAEWHLFPGWILLPFYAIIFVGVMFFAEFGNVPHRALIADLCPRSQLGIASALFAIYEIFGGLLGAAIIGPLYPIVGPIPQILVSVVISLVACLFTCLAILREPELAPLKKRNFLETMYSFFQPFIKSSDFRLIFCVAFLIYFGINMIQLLSLFFMIDVVKTFTFFNMITLFTDPTIANAIFLFIVMFGATVASGLGGGLSDLFGRKLFIFASCILFIIGGLSMVFLSFSYVLVVIMGVVMGMGIGCFGSVGYALATEVLPNPEEAAKDLAMFALSGSVPQAFASPFSGIVLDLGNALGRYLSFPVLGYYIVWIIATIFVAFAGFLAIFIRKGNLDLKKLRNRFRKQPPTQSRGYSEADSISSQDALTGNPNQ